MRKHESLYKRNRNERACSYRAVHVRQKVLKGQRKNRQLLEKIIRQAHQPKSVKSAVKKKQENINQKYNNYENIPSIRTPYQ